MGHRQCAGKRKISGKRLKKSPGVSKEGEQNDRESEKKSGWRKVRTLGT